MENEKDVIIDDIVEKETFGSKLWNGCKKAGSFIKENAEEIITGGTLLVCAFLPIGAAIWADKQVKKEEAEAKRKQEELMNDPEYWQAMKDEIERCDLYNEQVRRRADRELERLEGKSNESEE